MLRDIDPLILVVDDDPTLVRMIVTRLDWHGLRSITAESGNTALQIFEAERIDLVVTDVEMPDGDGISLTRAIRKISSAPVILLTGHRDEYRRELRNLEDVTVLKKPIPSIDIALAVEAGIERSRGLRANPISFPRAES